MPPPLFKERARARNTFAPGCHPSPNAWPTPRGMQDYAMGKEILMLTVMVFMSSMFQFPPWEKPCTKVDSEMNSAS